MSVGARALRTLEVARRVSDVLAQEGITVVGAEFDPIQVVNFLNPPRAPSRLVSEALATAAPTGGFPFPVVDLPHLVALKLATGAFRDEVDAGDLLEARADAPVEELRALCSEHGLGPALERVLGRLGRG